MEQRPELERSQELLELGDSLEQVGSLELLELGDSLEQVGNLEHLEPVGNLEQVGSLEQGDTLPKRLERSLVQWNRLEHLVHHMLELQRVNPRRRGFHRDRSRQFRCRRHRLQPRH